MWRAPRSNCRNATCRTGWRCRPHSAALLLLEEAALRRLELEARNALKHRMSGGGLESARAVLAIEDTLTRPAQLAPEGYGLPQFAEREAIANDAAALSARHQASRLLSAALMTTFAPVDTSS